MKLSRSIQQVLLSQQPQLTSEKTHVFLSRAFLCRWRPDCRCSSRCSIRLCCECKSAAVSSGRRRRSSRALRECSVPTNCGRPSPTKFCGQVKKLLRTPPACRAGSFRFAVCRRRSSSRFHRSACRLGTLSLSASASWVRSFWSWSTCCLQRAAGGRFEVRHFWLQVDEIFLIPQALSLAFLQLLPSGRSRPATLEVFGAGWVAVVGASVSGVELAQSASVRCLVLKCKRTIRTAQGCRLETPKTPSTKEMIWINYLNWRKKWSKFTFCSGL